METGVLLGLGRLNQINLSRFSGIKPRPTPPSHSPTFFLLELHFTSHPAAVSRSLVKASAIALTRSAQLNIVPATNLSPATTDLSHHSKWRRKLLHRRLLPPTTSLPRLRSTLLTSREHATRYVNTKVLVCFSELFCPSTEPHHRHKHRPSLTRACDPNSSRYTSLSPTPIDACDDIRFPWMYRNHVSR